MCFSIILLAVAFATAHRTLFPLLSFPLLQLPHSALDHLLKLVGGDAKGLVELFRQQAADELE